VDKVRSSGGDFLENMHAKEHHLRDQMEDLAANAAGETRDDDTRIIFCWNRRCRDSRWPLALLPERIAEIGTE